MRKFLTMIDTVREKGFLEYRDDGFKKRLNSTLGPNAEEDDKDDFFKYAEQARVFVFSPKNKTPQTVEGAEGISDPPFPVFSIEMIEGQNITVSAPGEDPVNTEAILVAEYAPAKFILYCLIECVGNRGVMRAFNDHKDLNYMGIVKEMINRINAEKMGLEKVRERVFLGTGKNKRRHTIREVIHITSRPESYPSEGHREVDWSHRFEVRGHWRKIEGIGKDRQGAYCIEGFTWVKDHIRGPEELPLVKKQRVVIG